MNIVPVALAADSGIVRGLNAIVPGGLSNIFVVGLSIGAAIAFGTIIYAGIMHSLAKGNSSKEKEARAWILAAAEGLAILAFGFILLNIVNPATTSVSEIDVEFIKIEETQPEPAGITDLSSVPDADKGYFSNRPLTSTSVSSAFGQRRLSDDSGCRLHSGIDFSATQGTPVYATANGTIIWSSEQGGYGNLIQIQDEKNYVYYFAHLSSFNVKKGDHVTVGNYIGNVGSTGHSFGAHLHYEIRKNNAAININSALGAVYPTGNGEVACAK